MKGEYSLETAVNKGLNKQGGCYKCNEINVTRGTDTHLALLLAAAISRMIYEEEDGGTTGRLDHENCQL